jgi:lipoic acid synthetase
MGFRHVESGPLVRSSYHAHEQAGSAASHESAVASFNPAVS